VIPLYYEQLIKKELCNRRAFVILGLSESARDIVFLSPNFSFKTPLSEQFASHKFKPDVKDWLFQI
jgi:hypothetical protein